MATIINALDKKSITFIEKQQMFFVSTAPKDGRINLSPKGLDCLRIIGPNKVIYANLTGSGNETSAHLLQDNRMTMMFCSFDRTTNIVRLYGHAREVTPEDDEFDELCTKLPKLTAIRQVFILTIDSIQSSCGYGVPIFDLVTQRETLEKYMVGLGEDGVKEYQQNNNLSTIDGIKTRLVEL